MRKADFKISPRIETMGSYVSFNLKWGAKWKTSRREIQAVGYRNNIQKKI
jgi:hypothetical protein